MLRSELITTIRKIEYALEVSQIEQALDRAGEQHVQVVLSAFNSFLRNLEPLSKIENVLLEILDLIPLTSADWWAMILGGGGKDERAHRELVRMMRNVDFVKTKLPQVISLLDRGEKQTPSKSNLTLIVPEQEGQVSTPERIMAAIDSIYLTYRAFCDLHGQPRNSLALTTCDSGSDKSFDFTGLPQIIEQVKVTIFEIVDRVIYFRERQYSERVKCVAESLPILTKIAEMVEAKKLSAEQAELLKRDLIGGATKFLETGSSIPELHEGSNYKPSSLLAPAPTLLLEGPNPSAKNSGATNQRSGIRPSSSAEETREPSSGFTDDELKRLRELIIKSESEET